MHDTGQRRAYRPKLPFKTVEGVGTLAWAKLDRGAVWVLMEFYGKFNGYNRYDLSLTYKEVKNKISSLLFTRCLWQCIGFGFLDVRRFGCLERNCSLFGLSSRWRKLNDDPKTLEKIEKNLKEVDRLLQQPGSLEKRMKIYRLRNSVLNLGNHKHSGKHGKNI